MAGKREIWTEEQITVVFYEYCRKPFGQFSSTKEFVVKLGELLHRSPSAIVRKVGNLASFDPKMKVRGVDGLGHTAKADKVVWEKYYNHWDLLAYDAERIIAKLKDKNLEDSLTIDLGNLPPGKERIVEIKKRINQDFFRQSVLSSYNQRCCITGISNPLLLQASHIVGWSQDESNRTNPENGLCLNVLFHKAYDENLVGITPDCEIVIAEDFLGADTKVIGEDTKQYIQSFNRAKLIMPRRFRPNRDFLAAHYEQYCQRNH